MDRPRPQITEIASVLSTRLSTPGVERTQAREAWRETLYHLLSRGAVGTFARHLARRHRDDAEVQAACEALAP